ncbi:MAG: hypothetical protein ACOCRX_02185 [Candidatus Woesearchaeota archaeon]
MRIPYKNSVFEIRNDKNKRRIKRNAKKAIEELFKKTKEIKNKEMKKNCFEEIWQIKLKYNLDLSKEIKMAFCRKCRSPDLSSRTNKGNLIRKCNDCGYIRRFPID